MLCLRVIISKELKFCTSIPLSIWKVKVELGGGGGGRLVVCMGIGNEGVSQIQESLKGISGLCRVSVIGFPNVRRTFGGPSFREYNRNNILGFSIGSAPLWVYHILMQTMEHTPARKRNHAYKLDQIRTRACALSPEGNFKAPEHLQITPFLGFRVYRV